MNATSRPSQGRRPRVACIVPLLLVLIAGFSCASAPGEPAIRLRWPEPPEITRITFVRSIYGPRVAPPPSAWRRFTNFLGVTLDDRVRPIMHAADIAVSPDGQLIYVSDFAQGIIHVFDLAAREVRYLAEASPMANPFGLTLDSSGKLYVVEQGARQVRVMSPEGETLRVIKDKRLIRPSDVAVDEVRGRIYVADPSRQNSPDHYVRVFDLEGNYLTDVGMGRGTGPGYLLFPTYLSLDAEGNLYVADTMNSRVSVFDPEGEFLRVIGERGDGYGQFDKPKGTAFDSLGNLYVTDSSWSNVQIFNPEGDVLLYFGGRGAYPGLLANPTGIAIASETDTIFVADYLNRRVVVYQLVNTSSRDDVPVASDLPQEPATD